MRERFGGEGGREIEFSSALREMAAKAQCLSTATEESVKIIPEKRSGSGRSGRDLVHLATKTSRGGLFTVVSVPEKKTGNGQR